MPIVNAQNLNRAYLTKTGPMRADFVSDIVDFKDMQVGSIQVKWSGNDALDGEIFVEGSNVPEDDWFDEVNLGYKILDDDGTKGKRKNQLFNLGLLGFRYARVKYFKGANTTGEIEIIALGKKGG